MLPEPLDPAKRWPREVQHDFNTNVRKSVDDAPYAPILPVAHQPLSRATNSRSAIEYVNTLPDDARNSIIKHSRLVDRRWQVDSHVQDALHYYRVRGCGVFGVERCGA